MLQKISVTFNQFNASLLNKSNNFFKNNNTYLTFGLKSSVYMHSMMQMLFQH